MSVRFLPAGDRAVVVEFDQDVGAELNRRLRALEFLIGDKRLAGIVEIVPSFRSLLVYYEPRLVGYDALCGALSGLIPQSAEAVLPDSRCIEVPCCYRDPTLGFDLCAVARRLDLPSEELIAIHTAAEYLVYFIGFAPGQPYLTGLPPRLAIPRLETPRTHTPAGSVGIGATQCCIYAVDSPGGFWVLGHTPVRVYDPAASTPILLCPGDRLRFRSIEREEYDRIAAEVEAGSYRAVIT